MLLPRLRSTKNSGGFSARSAIASDYRTRRYFDSGSDSRTSRDSNDVLDLVRGHTEISGYLTNRIPRLESIDEVLYPGTPMDNKRQAEGNPRIHDHLSVFIGGQSHRVSPAISSVMDAAQVVLDNLRELALLRPHNRQVHHLRRFILIRVIE